MPLLILVSIVIDLLVGIDLFTCINGIRPRDVVAYDHTSLQSSSLQLRSPTEILIDLAVRLAFECTTEGTVANLLPRGVRTRLCSLSEVVDQRRNLDSQV